MAAHTRHLSAPPSTAATYARAVAGMLPVVGKPGTVSLSADLPETTLALDGVTIDRHRLRDYCRVTGLRFGEYLPLTYFFPLQFPVMMDLMVSGDFPFSAIGSVHVENRVERTRPVSITERLDITVRAADLREHRKGLLVDLVAEFRVGSELVVTQTATLLSQQRTSLSGPSGPAPEDHQPPPAPAVLRVDQERIRDYAAASGDRNPIHMSSVSAKAFGFPRAIAHGMWTAAAALAPIEGRLPAAASYSVRWGKPLLLPGKAGLYLTPADGGYDVSVLDQKRGFPYLTGHAG